MSIEPTLAIDGPPAPEDGGLQETRRALVSSVLDSIQRFKQSWISIMILKAGVGLGQVCSFLIAQL